MNAKESCAFCESCYKVLGKYLRVQLQRDRNDLTEQFSRYCCYHEHQASLPIQPSGSGVHNLGSVNRLVPWMCFWGSINQMPIKKIRELLFHHLGHYSAQPHHNYVLTCSCCKCTDLLLFDIGDVNWRQAEAWNLPLAGKFTLRSDQMLTKRRALQRSWVLWKGFSATKNLSTTDLDHFPE